MNRPVILMYHGTPCAGCKGMESVPIVERETGAEIYDVPLTNFYQQMKCLKDKKYHVTTLTTTPKPTLYQRGGVVITLDDGEESNFSDAFPLLKELTFPAYFFVTVNRVGHPGYMSWGHLAELSNGGMIVGSHGLKHKILIDLPWEEIKKELSESKRILEAKLKREITDFSVPRGFYNSAVLTLASQAGYKNVFISQKKLTVQSFPQCFERLAVKGNWSLPQFEAALDGRLPWQERCRDLFLQSAKTILGAKGYNAARTVVLRLVRERTKLPPF